MFAMLKAMQYLEEAFNKDWVDSKSYEQECSKLITQHKSHYLGEFKDKVGPLNSFAAMHNLSAGRAIHRFEMGVPATLEHLSNRGDNAGGKAIMDCVKSIANCKDSVELDMVETDHLLPLIRAIMEALCKIPKITSDLDGPRRVKAWFARLNQRAAHERLAVDEQRQLKSDLDVLDSDLYSAL